MGCQAQNCRCVECWIGELTLRVLVPHGIFDLVTQELVDASSELGVQGVWVVHCGHLQV